MTNLESTYIRVCFSFGANLIWLALSSFFINYDYRFVAVLLPLPVYFLVLHRSAWLLHTRRAARLAACLGLAFALCVTAFIALQFIGAWALKSALEKNNW